MYTHTLTLFQSLKHPLGPLTRTLPDLSIPNPFLSRTDVRKIHCPKPKNSGLGPVCNHVNSIDIHTYEYNTYTYTSIFVW